MTVRIPLEIAPPALDAMRGVERYLATCGLERSLCELVKLRVSMLNGCAYCVDMHQRKLRELGESEARLFGLLAWREQAGYSPREQAALAWAESLTDAPRTRVPDSDFQAARERFSPKELGDLSYAVAQINAWNRLCVAFRIEPQHGISATKDQR